ncbi:prolyl 4-hydroxylase subunit alpha-2 isoform X1 [Folsomia candida]|uniref:prolyl 4-hydroxylase subunit alpha-2 isoform X1 n=1 Tax=Folsomia candida TaxID=158441 RepID=UPI00160502C3|nr:prolyl 4-hydroxylase subunit alpha-2 isoform X1 [Folsomia candida]
MVVVKSFPPKKSVLNLKLIVALGSIFLVGLVSGKGEDYYTSLVGLGQLAVHEQVILESVLDYKTALLKRLGLIERYLQEYESSLVSPQMEKNYPQLHKSIRKSRARHWDKKCVPTFQEHAELTDLQRYTVSNPIAAFRIIRRIGKQLVELLMDFETEIETDFVTLMDDMFDKIRIPNSEDVDGAVDGILRIQSTYGISIDQFVSGNFGVPGVGLTSAFDQHYVGVKASAMGFYAVGLQWLDTARKTLLQNYDPADETSLTLNMAEEVLLTTVRKHNEGMTSKEDAMNKYAYFSHPLSPNVSTLIVPRHNLYYVPDNLVVGRETESFMDAWNYQAICGGKNLLPLEIRRQLFCYYKSDTPLTFLSPVGVEVHSIKPKILQFYDIVRNTTIHHILTRNAATLSRGRVLGSPDDRDVKSDVRTSQVTWLYDEPTDEKVKRIPAIIGDLTGLNAQAGSNAEELQLSSYGAIGGHYQQHFDLLFNEAHLPFIPEKELIRGDRIATVMFYFSNVTMGGGTAFPRVGVATPAVRGSAAFWYNLKRNGQPDPLSLHGGCPVGQGIKWGKYFYQF